MAGCLLPAGRVLGLTRLTLPTGGGHDPAGMEPGDFAWFRDRGPSRPVVIIASIPRQLVHVYRGGVLLGVSTCSTGKPGNSTPAGLFKVLTKIKVHRSSKYGDPMPNTLRLTWKGVALHGGELPGYPASHGCVRLPLAFADELFEMTELGTTVVIGGRADHPLVHGSGVVPAGNAERIIAARDAARSLAPFGEHADSVILVSAADRRIYALQDGTIVAQAPATIANATEALGTNIFVWRGGDASQAGSIWQGARFVPVPGGVAAVADTAMLTRLRTSHKVMGTIEKLMHPGTLLLATDDPLNPGRQRLRRRSRKVAANHRSRKRRRPS